MSAVLEGPSVAKKKTIKKNTPKKGVERKSRKGTVTIENLKFLVQQLQFLSGEYQAVTEKMERAGITEGIEIDGANQHQLGLNSLARHVGHVDTGYRKAMTERMEEQLSGGEEE